MYEVQSFGRTDSKFFLLLTFVIFPGCQLVYKVFFFDISIIQSCNGNAAINIKIRLTKESLLMLETLKEYGQKFVYMAFHILEHLNAS